MHFNLHEKTSFSPDCVVAYCVIALNQNDFRKILYKLSEEILIFSAESIFLIYITVGNRALFLIMKNIFFPQAL